MNADSTIPEHDPLIYSAAVVATAANAAADLRPIQNNSGLPKDLSTRLRYPDRCRNLTCGTPGWA
jgi:hypothetical protein